jgi:hypothetical protein
MRAPKKRQIIRLAYEDLAAMLGIDKKSLITVINKSNTSRVDFVVLGDTPLPAKYIEDDQNIKATTPTLTTVYRLHKESDHGRASEELYGDQD